MVVVRELLTDSNDNNPWPDGVKRWPKHSTSYYYLALNCGNGSDEWQPAALWTRDADGRDPRVDMTLDVGMDARNRLALPRPHGHRPGTDHPPKTSVSGRPDLRPPGEYQHGRPHAAVPSCGEDNPEPLMPTPPLCVD